MPACVCVVRVDRSDALGCTATYNQTPYRYDVVAREIRPRRLKPPRDSMALAPPNAGMRRLTLLALLMQSDFTSHAPQLPNATYMLHGLRVHVSP